MLANFSYRGPTLGQYADETKPDITAPGVNIYAALDDQDGNYGLMSGTSMATPHVTGSAALIRAVHPDWTPTEVKSALLTTATNADGTQEDGTTTWTIDQVGHGRVDLTKAALAGLTMDETGAHYLAANPSGAAHSATGAHLRPRIWPRAMATRAPISQAGRFRLHARAGTPLEAPATAPAPMAPSDRAAKVASRARGPTIFQLIGCPPMSRHSAAQP